MTQGATGSDEAARHPSPGAVAPAVALIGITKAFPGVVANNDIHLAAMSGEVLCLLGENGAGKSTLMSILSGIYRPDAGRIEVDGRRSRSDRPAMPGISGSAWSISTSA